MSHDEHAEGVAHDPGAAQRSRRRKRAAVGVVGLAAMLGGGAFLVTEHLTDTTVISDGSAPNPLIPRPEVSASLSGRPPSPSQAPAGTVSRKSSPGPAGRPTTARERVDAARASAAKNNVEVQRPLPAASVQRATNVLVTNSGSLKEDGRTLRVVSASGDLTGFKELAWVADEGQKVDAATCTQTFRFADNATAARKPNLLICWRTSATRSVYTVMVDLDGKPSTRDSVAALAKQWSRLD